jgi:CHAD domain-containing protein
LAATTPAKVHHEVESKFDVGPGFQLPDLATLPGASGVDDAEVQQLEATYFDTDDLRLIRHGTTFRRRTGGTDAGWTLKLPAPESGRDEFQQPIRADRDEIPADLAGLVRLQLRDAALVPVARISTRRVVHRVRAADGLVLAEVADDQVTAEALGSELTTDQWREIEVELVEGGDDLLTQASLTLIAAGAAASASSSKLARALDRRLRALDRPEVSGLSQLRRRPGRPKRATVGEVTVDYLARHVDALIAHDVKVRLDAEDSIHQMRVATRRLRAGLATGRPLFIHCSCEHLRAELKWLGGLLGVARDAEVMHARLTQEIEEQPAELVVGPVLERVDLELDAAYTQARQEILAALDGERYLALVTALERFVTVPPFGPRAAKPATRQFQALVRRAAGRVTKAVAELPGARGEGLDHQLHQVRIAAKRARYAAEAARPTIGKPAKALADAMEAIQETLGTHQDTVVEQQWLRDLGRQAHLNGENAFTFGHLHGLAAARSSSGRDEFDPLWRRTAKLRERWPG